MRLTGVANATAGRSASRFLLLALIALMAACSPRAQQPGVGTPAACQIVYDAGSSGTRLHVYERAGTGWKMHGGPVAGALADPVRNNRGKTVADAPALVQELVDALDALRNDGPMDGGGVPRWPAFDWPNRCKIENAALYATGGMRLAEQRDSEASARLMGMVEEALSARLGMTVTARTLSGYEEGLFAWLAVRETQPDDEFGIAEMGGASLQVTFPCEACDAARVVRVKGRPVQLAGYSLLGWGQDEAWEVSGAAAVCALGAGKDANWRVEDCNRQFGRGLADSGQIRNRVAGSPGLRWYLAGAFRYMEDTDLERFCMQGDDSGYQPETACFRAAYLRWVLDEIGLPQTAEKGAPDWPLGAAVCAATQCLGPPG